MSDVATLIADMVRAGVDPDIIGRTAAALSTQDTRTARQLRNARYYERKASEKRLNASNSDVSDAATPSPKESPHTPKETPPSSPTTPKENPLRGQKKAVRLPADFAPDLDWAVGQGLSFLQANTEAAKFRDFWTAKGGKDAAKLDWAATWRNWVRSALERLPQSRAGPAPPKRNAALAAADALMEKFDAVSPSQTEADPPYPRLVALTSR